MNTKLFLKYRLTSALLLSALLFVLGGFFWAYAGLSGQGAGPFILHFNDFDGITDIGDLGTILFMGTFGVLAVLADAAIAFEFEGRDPFLGKLMASLALVFGILLFIGFAAILKVN